ncbi:putative Vancomycin resistance protein YoaR [Abditibacterium utsteinense]|uniref:Putative Vancomycin resistance protein YoaR n=1 Tax=Abditibacterium utsteinense TaxID=1960156 RepID=A0A2S8SPY5_9BACT|nr:VanW family protein [Abditibacterium utsteinense]PQV62844.1 putative Vancomycin resistance protein YoaR [Abditibacterium utsteinense]
MTLHFLRRSLLLTPLLLTPLVLTFSEAVLSAPASAAKFGAARVGGISISGLDEAGATRRLKRELAPKLDKRIGIAAGRKIVYRTRRELGFSLDVGKMLGRAAKNKSVPVAFRVNQNSAARALNRLAPSLSSQPRDAIPVLFKGKVKIRPSVAGSHFDASKSAARLMIQAEKESSKTRFKLVANSLSPRLTTNRLKGIHAVLGTFTTRYNPGQVKRTRNMGIAIRAIDGTLLSPGEVFSLNKTVGERSQARGYRTAVIFEGGKKEPGIGGGVSQVTGTIFNAALVAGLPIKTYQVHSRPVKYLPLGRDATVSWGNFDMKFANDTKAPVYISYQRHASSVTATLFGKKTGKRGQMRVVSKKVGEREIEAILYRTIRQGGKVVKKERVGSSHYNWKDDNED